MPCCAVLILYITVIIEDLVWFSCASEKELKRLKEIEREIKRELKRIEEELKRLKEMEREIEREIKRGWKRN